MNTSIVNPPHLSTENVEQLLQERAAFAAIIEFSEDAIIGKTLDGIVTSWNKSAETIYGYTALEMIGHNINILAPPDRAEEIPKILEKIKKGGTIKHFETTRMRKNGSLVNISLSVSPIKNAKNEIVAAAVIARDITVRKRLQEAEINMQPVTALKEANKELETFSYSVSHDLRAPIRAIDGFSKILSEDYAPKLDEDGQKVIATIRNTTRQMGDLIDDLLAFSRIGRREIKATTVDMESLVKAVYTELKLVNDQRSIQFTCEKLPMAYVDPTLMRIVWSNLLSNAIKYTGKKKLAVISVKSKVTNTDTIYFVKDNGAGFDMKYVNKLFGVFQRLHSAQEFEGTGIGLSIVARIISKHKGKVAAEGVVDSGATFSFSIPNKV